MAPGEESFDFMIYLFLAVVLITFAGIIYFSLFHKKQYDKKSASGFDGKVAVLIEELSSKLIQDEYFENIKEDITRLAWLHRKHPDIAALWLHFYLRKGLLEDAVQMAANIRFNRKYGKYYNEKSITECLAETYDKLGDKRKALAEYLILHKGEPDNLSYLEKSAYLAEDINKKRAAEMWQNIAETFPDHSEALYKVGKINLENKSYNMALDYFQMARDNGYNTSEPDYCYSLATVLNKIGGREQAALRNYEIAARLGSDELRKQALPFLANLYFRSKDYISTIEVLSEYFSQFECTLQFELLMAAAYEKLLKIHEACVIWRDIQEQYPDNKWVQNKLELYSTVNDNIAVYYYMNAEIEDFVRICKELVEQQDDMNSTFEYYLDMEIMPFGCYIQKVFDKPISKGSFKNTMTTKPNPTVYMFFRSGCQVRENFVDVIIEKMDVDTHKKYFDCPYQIYIYTIDSTVPNFSNYIGSERKHLISICCGEKLQHLLAKMHFSGVEELRVKNGCDLALNQENKVKDFAELRERQAALVEKRHMKFGTIAAGKSKKDNSLEHEPELL